MLIGYIALLISTDVLLIELKLFLMGGRICPLDCTHCFHWLVMVIDNDDVVTQDCLNCLHPVCMNDTWWHLVSCCGIVDKSELNDLQSHCLVDFIRISSARDSDIRHVTSKTQNITSVPKYDLFNTYV
jgi:hypothetical protein